MDMDTKCSGCTKATRSGCECMVHEGPVPEGEADKTHHVNHNGIVYDSYNVKNCPAFIAG